MLYLIFIFFVLFVGVYITVWFLLLALSNVDRLHDKTIVKHFPKVSVLVPAHNEEEHITKSLESLANLDYPKNKYEVIVIDNGSTDKTYKKAQQFKRKFSKKLKKIRLLRLPTPSKSKALNAGLKYVTGDIVGILDADTFVTKDCLRKMVSYFKDEKVGAVTNYIKPTEAKGLLASLQNIEYIFSSFSKKIISILDSLYIVPGTLSLIRKDIIKKIGFSGGTLTEDMDVALCILKRGYSIRNCMDAVAYTVVPTNLPDLFRQRVRWYRGFIQNISKHSDIIFNKQHPHLGYFVFPISSFLAIFVGVALSLILLTNLFHNSLLFIRRLFYIPVVDTLILLTLPIKTFGILKLFMSPYSTIVYGIILMASLTAVIVSFKLQKVKIWGNILLLPIYFFIYYILIMVFWFVSLLTELLRLRKKW
jgi:cellulose synthase/poly-beta-1,6-N-acetylglucosamine synthase-like glycosyltransferase